VGKAIEQSGTSVVSFFDLIVRWFVYLIAIVAAANILQLEFLTNLLQDIVLYLPHVAMFLIILIGGFILVDYFADLLDGWGKTQDIEFLGVIIMLLRVFFYFIILVLALSQLLIDLTIIYTFVTPIAWGVGLGLGAGIAIFIGFGLKDRAPRMMDDMIKKFSK
jgi:small-conductance mechanosensitive channel